MFRSRRALRKIILEVVSRAAAAARHSTGVLLLLFRLFLLCACSLAAAQRTGSAVVSRRPLAADTAHAAQVVRPLRALALRQRTQMPCALNHSYSSRSYIGALAAACCIACKVDKAVSRARTACNTRNLEQRHHHGDIGCVDIHTALLIHARTVEVCNPKLRDRLKIVLRRAVVLLTLAADTLLGTVQSSSVSIRSGSTRMPSLGSGARYSESVVCSLRRSSCKSGLFGVCTVIAPAASRIALNTSTNRVALLIVIVKTSIICTIRCSDGRARYKRTNPRRRQKK